MADQGKLSLRDCRRYWYVVHCWAWLFAKRHALAAVVFALIGLAQVAVVWAYLPGQWTKDQVVTFAFQVVLALLTMAGVYLIGLLLAPAHLANRRRVRTQKALAWAVSREVVSSAAHRAEIAAVQSALAAARAELESEDQDDGAFVSACKAVEEFVAEGIRIAHQITPQNPRDGEVFDYLARTESYVRRIFGPVVVDRVTTNSGVTHYSGLMALLNFRIGTLTALRKEMSAGTTAPRRRSAPST